MISQLDFDLMAKNVGKRGKPKLPVPTEHREQSELCKWLRKKKIGFFSVPNAQKGHRFAVTRWLKEEGLTAGAPDLVLLPVTPHAPFRHIAIEMKRSKGGTVDPKQEEFHAQMRVNGWHVFVARGAADAIKQLSDMGF